MRTIERTTQFKRDYEREMKGRHRASLQADLAAVVTELAADRPLSHDCAAMRLSGTGATIGTAM